MLGIFKTVIKTGKDDIKRRTSGRHCKQSPVVSPSRIEITGNNGASKKLIYFARIAASAKTGTGRLYFRGLTNRIEGLLSFDLCDLNYEYDYNS
jgi:hypothetical protein